MNDWSSNENWDDDDDWDTSHLYNDAEEFGEPGTIYCSACNAEIYENAEACPHCGEYQTGSRKPWAGKPTWYIALALLGIFWLIIAMAINLNL